MTDVAHNVPPEVSHLASEVHNDQQQHPHEQWQPGDKSSMRGGSSSGGPWVRDEADCARRQAQQEAEQAAAAARRAAIKKDKEEAIRRCLEMRGEPVDTTLTWLEQESEEGCIEYKFKLNNPHPVRLQQLVRLQWCSIQGSGLAVWQTLEVIWFVGLV